MNKIIELVSSGLSISRAAVESTTIATRPASEPLMRNGTRSRARRKARVVSLPVLLLGIVGALWVTTATAQYHTIYMEPLFLFNDGYLDPPTPYEPLLSAAFADVQIARGGCRGGLCYSYSNLTPVLPPATLGFLFDGIPYWQYFDQTVCDSNGQNCNTSHQWGVIQTTTVCPAGAGGGYYNSPNPDRLIACALTIYDVQPPPKDCRSCIGNPIYAGNGQKMQVETDYAGVGGLNFIRTYRSNNGSFASVLTQAFVNNSLPPGTTSPTCYAGYWTAGNQSGYYCFPYISISPNGVATYQVQTDDGRSIAFTGTNNAVTGSADSNVRVTQITVGGVVEWQVRRDDDSVELYNTKGSLIKKTLRGGQSFTYTYSTSSTPVNIAPRPGLLLTESDAFGHMLSWQYNAAGQMTVMTDPAGKTYTYQYSGAGNLTTAVTYPDGSSKGYWYNESVNTAGTNLPTALTGIIDESGVRFATFQYNSGGYAVNTQHAGRVDSYTFTYPYTSYMGSNYSASVTDPLGTTRSYNFSSDGLSYNLDSSQTQPAASGSGTVTQSETHDANGNIASLTDYNGNVTTHLYDLTRNLETSRTEASGTAQARTITTQWNTTWRQPALITEPNRTTAVTYDTVGNVLTKTITDTATSTTRIWTYTYDGYGRMLTADGPRTDVVDRTTFTYYTCTAGYQCGQVNTLTNAMGQITTFHTYNAHGQPLTVTDPNGVVTTLTYDARLRLKSRQIGTETTSYAYYPTGSVADGDFA